MSGLSWKYNVSAHGIKDNGKPAKKSGKSIECIQTRFNLENSAVAINGFLFLAALMNAPGIFLRVSIASRPGTVRPAINEVVVASNAWGKVAERTPIHHGMLDSE